MKHIKLVIICITFCQTKISNIPRTMFDCGKEIKKIKIKE